VEKEFKDISFKSIEDSLTPFLKMMDFTQSNEQEERQSLIL